jgi:hypothetical protein
MTFSIQPSHPSATLQLLLLHRPTAFGGGLVLGNAASLVPFSENSWDCFGGALIGAIGADRHRKT